MTKSRHLLVGATCGRQPGVGNKYRIVEHYTTGGVWPTCGHPTAGSPKYRSKYEWATSIRVLGIRTGRSKTTILVGMPVELWYKNWRAVEDRPYSPRRYAGRISVYGLAGGRRPPLQFLRHMFGDVDIELQFGGHAV
jgi:hypothetical protein